MRLFLHIGLPRTGTTTLQTKLFQKDKIYYKVKEIERKEVLKDLDALSREFVEIVNLANINPTKHTNAPKHGRLILPVPMVILMF